MNCINEMEKAGLCEMSRWTLKQLFHDKNNAPGRLYLWLKLSDWQDIRKMGTIEEKLGKLIDDVLYVGIDANDEHRFDTHLSPLQHCSPFDRYLKRALSVDEKFVAIYFGRVTSKDVLYETLLIRQLNMLKASRRVPQLYNIQKIKLGDFIGNCNSSEFTSVLVCLLKDALLKPTVKMSTDSHNQKVKQYLANVAKLHTAQLKTFIKDTIEQMHANNGTLQVNDDSNNDLMQETIECSIFKLEGCTLKFNCLH